ncbi:hypothetical protein [Fluviispira multicolorata]|uniref:Uncharacterized protein n=1 Tax=Fluviispira multicolorata TaxID=2654512 RepID=A0A833N290_9BACT|nr:hypothetical protein [Fluviispira multicolorata]KAB8032062.1 hypothetical protein GCL57_05285 [Fluviispira multicolorata]
MKCSEEQSDPFKNKKIFYVSEDTAPFINRIFDSHYAYTINTIVQSIKDNSNDIFKYLGTTENVEYAKKIIIPALLLDGIIYESEGGLKCDYDLVFVVFGDNKYYTSKYTAQAALAIANKCAISDNQTNITNSFEHVQKRSKMYVEERRQIIRKALNEIMTAPFANTKEDQCVVDYAFIMRIENA